MGGILSCCFYCSSCDYALKNAERGDDFSLKGESVCAKVVSVYDGDTLRVVIRRRGELVQYNVGERPPSLSPSYQCGIECTGPIAGLQCA